MLVHPTEHTQTWWWHRGTCSPKLETPFSFRSQTGSVRLFTCPSTNFQAFCSCAHIAWANSNFIFSDRSHAQQMWYAKLRGKMGLSFESKISSLWAMTGFTLPQCEPRSFTKSRFTKNLSVEIPWISSIFESLYVSLKRTKKKGCASLNFENPKKTLWDACCLVFRNERKLSVGLSTLQ